MAWYEPDEKGKGEKIGWQVNGHHLLGLSRNTLDSLCSKRYQCEFGVLLQDSSQVESQHLLQAVRFKE